MRKLNLKKFVPTAVGLAVAVASTASHAALTVDTAAITDAGAAVATVGGAVFAVIIGIKVWKWVRSAA